VGRGGRSAGGLLRAALERTRFGLRDLLQVRVLVPPRPREVHPERNRLRLRLVVVVVVVVPREERQPGGVQLPVRRGMHRLRNRQLLTVPRHRENALNPSNTLPNQTLTNITPISQSPNLSKNLPLRNTQLLSLVTNARAIIAVLHNPKSLLHKTLTLQLRPPHKCELVVLQDR
jgi:hypothetical protein